MNTLKKRKGFIGLALLVISLVMIIIASSVLFNMFYMFFKLGVSEESMSKNYAGLSSGIYYGTWLADHGFITSAGLVTIDTLDVDKVTVTIKGKVNSGVYTIQASIAGGKTITATYNKTILTWQ
jgi:hypothetical protein